MRDNACRWLQLAKVEIYPDRAVSDGRELYQSLEKT